MINVRKARSCAASHHTEVQKGLLETDCASVSRATRWPDAREEDGSARKSQHIRQGQDVAYARRLLAICRGQTWWSVSGVRAFGRAE